MPEPNDVISAEDTAEESSTETTEQEQSTEESGENQLNTAGESSEESKSVPYERFKEVIDSNRQLKEKFEQLTPHLERLQRQPEPEQVDPSQFETVDELVAHLTKQNDKTWSERERALEAKFNARLEANNKLNELKQAYPSEMKNTMFRSLVINSMRENPNSDVNELASRVKSDFEKLKEEGRKAAKEEFIQKGTFQGKSVGNQPIQRDKETQDFVSGIVEAGGKAGDSIF